MMESGQSWNLDCNPWRMMCRWSVRSFIKARYISHIYISHIYLYIYISQPWKKHPVTVHHAETAMQQQSAWALHDAPASAAVPCSIRHQACLEKYLEGWQGFALIMKKRAAAALLMTGRSTTLTALTALTNPLSI